MSFDNEYPNRKDWRPVNYRGGTAFIQPGCRNHGFCKWCADKRMLKERRQAEMADDMESEENTEE